jgi:hypothetical protein
MFHPLKRVCMWTVLGLATVFLIGPVVAAIGIILPFALIGCGVWFAARGVRRLSARLRARGAADVLPQVARGARVVFVEGVQKCKDLGPAVRDGAQAVGRGARVVVRQGIHHCREMGPVLRQRALRLRERAAERGRRVVRVLTEVVCGSLAGALIGWYAVGPQEAIAVGAAAGAALGLVSGVLTRIPPTEVATVE